MVLTDPDLEETKTLEGPRDDGRAKFELQFGTENIVPLSCDRVLPALHDTPYHKHTKQ
jgi:hypothetical protein